MNKATVWTIHLRSTEGEKVSKFEGEKEMETVNLTGKLNMGIHEGLGIKTAARILGGLVLGALVMAATALPLGAGSAYADEPARPLSVEQMENLADMFQTEVWLPGDTYPVAGNSGGAASVGEADIPGFMQTEIYLPGDVYPVTSRDNTTAKAGSADLPGFMQTEIWLPGDAYPVSSDAEDLPGFMQTEVWLPGDSYPGF